jgi:hypothetical protein
MTVPLGGVRPHGDVTCARLTPAGHCGEPAIAHVLWDAEMNNGVVCFRHWLEARASWPFYDHHSVGNDSCCTWAGTAWIFSWDEPPGHCAVALDPSLMELEAAQAPANEEAAP